MAIAFGQETNSGTSLAGASSTTVAVSITPAAVGTILFGVFLGQASSPTTATVSDSVNGSWTVLDSIGGSGGGESQVFSAWVKNTTTSAITVTATFAAALTQRGARCTEITGGDGTTPLADHNGTRASVAGSTTDGITSGSMTASGASLVIGYIKNDGSGNSATAGTGFTAGTILWNGSGDFCLLEYKRVASGGTFPVTATPNAATDVWLTVGAIFNEASSGTSVALTGLGVTASKGTMVPAWAQALTGAAATSAGGTATPAVAPPLTGASATSAGGTLAPAVSVAVTGLAATSAEGNVNVAGGGTAALTGQSVTASGGTMAPAIGVPLAGSAATSSGGSMAPAVSAPLSGRAASAAGGAISASAGAGAALTGLSATASGGVMTPSISAPLTGLSASAAGGSVSPLVSVGLLGRAAAASLGSFGAAISRALAGIAATVSGGRFVFNENLPNGPFRVAVDDTSLPRVAVDEVTYSVSEILG